VVADRFVPRDDDAITADPRTTVVEGDLLETVPRIFARRVDAVLHLASAVSAEAEADFDLGMTANVQSTLALLEAARHQSGEPATVVFSSSVAVYGSDPGAAAAGRRQRIHAADTAIQLRIQKFICEQLVADYTRKGFIDGRIARLMTVAVRLASRTPRRPGSYLGSSASHWPGLRRSVRCGPSSPSRLRRRDEPWRDSCVSRRLSAETIRQAERAHRRQPAGTHGDGRGDARHAAQIAGDAVADLVSVEPDPAVEAIVGSWPARFDNSRAAALGLTATRRSPTSVTQYRDDNL
jgi:nucleoside-diphosphate-sugar epimerase